MISNVKRPRLGIDIDETIVELLDDFLLDYNLRHHTEFKKQNFKTYHWWTELGITKTQAYQEAEDYFKFRVSQYTKDLGYALNSLNIIPEVENIWLPLLAKHFELYGITDRNEEILGEDSFQLSTALFYPYLEDLGLDGLALPDDRIYYTTTLDIRSQEPVTKSKPHLCKELGLVGLIDDNPDVALACINEGVNVYVPNKPWNQGLNISNPLFFQGSFREIYRQIRRNHLN